MKSFEIPLGPSIESDGTMRMVTSPGIYRISLISPGFRRLKAYKRFDGKGWLFVRDVRIDLPEAMLAKLEEPAGWLSQVMEIRELERAIKNGSFECKSVEKHKKMMVERKKELAKIWQMRVREFQIEKARHQKIEDSQNERLLDAYLAVSINEWPNVCALGKHYSRKQLEEALFCDLVARGSEETGTVTVAVAQKIVDAKKKMEGKRGNSDRFNDWLLRNWFHGLRLFEKNKRQRGQLAREKGFATMTDGNVAKRCSALILTERRSKRDDV